MQVENIQGLVIQDFNLKFKKCGCYVKNAHELKVRPRTHVAMPLKHIDYNIEITNSLASVTLEQKYYNPTQKFLEVEFSFPIDPKSCIYKFVAEFGNKRIEGIVKQKQQAKKEYQQAVKQGKQAVYAQIDPNSSDIMNLEVGNIDPESEVKISVSYLQELNIEQNTFYQLHLASTISPRYMNDRVGRRVNHDYYKNLNEPVKHVSGQYTWTFKITLLTAKKIIYHNSPSHKLQLLSSNEQQNQMIFVLQNQELPNKDLHFLFTTEDFHLPSYVFGRTNVSSTAMLSFIPKFCELTVDDAYRASIDHKSLQSDMNSAKGQYIFLLDRSGSMGGSRIEKAKKALVIFLQSLPPNTYFNVVSFGNANSSLFNESVKYDQKNLNKAVKEVERMRADMGGTEIYNPLNVIYNRKNIEGYPRQIFLLTDGGVSNTNSVIDLVQKKTKFSRCHSIGIGNGCSEALIKGCADKGKGKYIFISDSDDPADKIIGLLEETLTPVIDSVKLVFDKTLVESVVPNPESIPYILKNQIVNFYITFKGQLDTKTNFQFSYQDSLNKQPYSSNIQINPDSVSFPFVDKMSHNKIIKKLQRAAKNNEPIEQQMYYVKVKDHKQQAIKQSVKNQILSEYTAFICVAKELVDGKYEQIKDKGQEKIKVESIQPVDYGLERLLQRGQRMECLNLRSANLSSSSQQFYKQSAKKKSAGFGFGNMLSGAVSSVADGFSGLFGSKAKMASMDKAPNSYNRGEQFGSRGGSRGGRGGSFNPPPMRSMARSSNIERQQKICLDSKPQNHRIELESKNDCWAFKCDDQDDDNMAEQLSSPTNNISTKEQKKDKKEKQSSNKRRRSKKQSSGDRNRDKMQNDESSDDEAQQNQIIKPPSVSIEEIIKQQNVDGSFNNKSLISKLYSNKFKEIQAEMQNYDLDIAITFLIAKWIEKFYPQKQYALIVKKAYSWIKTSVKLESLQSLQSLL